MRALLLCIGLGLGLGCGGPRGSAPDPGGTAGPAGTGSTTPPAGSGSTGGSASGCRASDCGPRLGMPSQQCADGSIGGNTGRCIRLMDGSCGWEIRECPDSPDSPTTP